MKRRLLRALLKDFIGLLCALLLLTGFLLSRTGLQSVAWCALRVVPGLQSLRVQGSLAGPLTIEELIYRHDAAAIAARDLVIDVSLKALLRGDLVIHTLHARFIALKLAPPASQEKSTTFDLESLRHLAIEHLQIEQLILEPYHVSVQLAGSLTDTWHLQITAQQSSAQALALMQGQEALAASALETVNAWPSGSMAATVNVRGAKLRPQLQARVIARALQFKAGQLAHMQLDLKLDLAAQQASQFMLSMEGLKLGDTLIKTLRARADGQLNPALALRWNLQAQLQATAAQAGALAAQGTVTGTCAAPQFAVQLEMRNARYGTSRLVRASAQLTAALNSAAKAQTLQLAQRLNAQLVLTLSGLQAQQYRFTPLRLRAVLSSVPASLNLTLAPGAIHYAVAGTPRTLTWQPSAISLLQKNAETAVTGNLVLNATQMVSADVQLPHYQLLAPLAPSQAVQGKVSIHVQQLAPFLSTITALHNARGRLRADLQLAGTIAQPRVRGTLLLDQASIDVPALNLKIRDVRLQGQNDALGNINWNGQARSGTGVLKISGVSALGKRAATATIKLTGADIVVSDAEHYHLHASPNLTASYADHLLTLTGTLAFPSAQINLGSNTGTAIELSKDVVFVGTEKKIATALPIAIKVQTTLGDNVHLQYAGFSTQLRGHVLVSAAPNKAITGSGEISFHEGAYTYYGQSLALGPYSRLIFNGAIDNPLLSIQAVRTVEANTTATTSATNVASNSSVGNVNTLPTKANLSSTAMLPGQKLKLNVGVNVQGTAKDPQISLFAEPAILTQTEILSYLLVGQAPDELGSASAGILFNAVSSLNFGGSSQLKNTMQELQKSTGVDFDIKSSAYVNPQTNQTQQNTSVVLGKALSPKIYLSYSIGLLEELNTLQLRYILSKYWTLQSTTNSLGNGIDLLYMIERGK